MAPTEKVLTDRVHRANIGPYDQMFAITQYLINTGLQTKWKKQLTEDPDSTLLQAFNCKQHGIGRITNAFFDCPRIMVEVGYEEALQGACYIMCFKSGIMKIEYEIDPAPMDGSDDFEIKKYDLTGWKIAFSLQLGMTKVEQESDKFKKTLGKEVQNGEGLMGQKIKAGQYSLNELSAKFETAEFNLERTYFGGVDWASEPKGVKESFKILIEKHKQTLLTHLKDQGVVGFAIKSNNQAAPQVPSLTFEPYKIQYQTYPWKDPRISEYKPTVGLTDNSRLNYLLFCETTGTNELPDIGNRFLKYSGNFTDGRITGEANSESVDFGAFYMSRKNFFDSYLLKKLRVLNWALEPSVRRVYTKVDNWSSPTAIWETDIQVGKTTVTDPSEREKFKNDPFYDFIQDPTSKTTWNFKSSYNPNPFWDQSGLDGWAAKVKAECRCSTHNTLSFEPGTDIITIEGKSHIYMSFYFWEHFTFKANKEKMDELEWEITWKMQLDLEAVNDGGLQIKSEFTPAKMIELKNNLSGLNEYKAYTDKAIRTAISNMDDLRQALATELKEQPGLCLPASGVFYFKNPVLSHKGDLVCSVSYNDTESAEFFNPKTKTVLNKDAKDRDDIAGGNRVAAPPPPGAQQVPLKTE